MVWFIGKPNENRTTAIRSASELSRELDLLLIGLQGLDRRQRNTNAESCAEFYGEASCVRKVAANRDHRAHRSLSRLLIP